MFFLPSHSITLEGSQGQFMEVMYIPGHPTQVVYPLIAFKEGMVLLRFPLMVGSITTGKSQTTKILMSS
ncbi:uncharacterized protein Nmag_1897 [Natrialba magadii ATCC 43099]|uniref:Uncharacterized protein n=1 Tax=Natrialba magadii (strain ATCC 43099 / DSM 3394 / CCM 3739 / CIP 104546 / IAM 13178 / JCM 8861 / NBRC 102185 / NCIMB 2190 / MS3) TaxID=547559 RepID=D3SV60_NATMM|nr:uncharacterized protein Nmag_1897 [Natrialba magadii ATCC 43099]ELY29222.1 hypothetical protein C500_10900 [Natrialba magadii ATCC 43099]